MADDLRQRYADELEEIFKAGDDGLLDPREAFAAILVRRDSDLQSWRERAENAEAANARVRALHRVHRCEDGHQRASTPNPCFNNRMCSCGHRDPCPTLAALGDPQER